MKKISQFNKTVVLIILNLFLFNDSSMQAQCSANFNFTLGANGTSTFASTSAGTSSNTSYFWNIGNSSYSNWSPNLLHVFTDNQLCYATLVITDTSASPTCSSSITKTIGVTTVPCFSNVSIYSSLQANGNVVFGSNQIGSVANGYSFLWSFGDGGTSTLDTPNHTYSANAVYNVSLTAISYSSVCTYTAASTVSVSIISCTLNAGFTYTSYPNGLIHFKTSATPTNVAHKWEFNDGNPSVTGYIYDTISRRFPSNLNYPVKHSLFFWSPFWCSDSISQPIPVSNATACSAYSNFNLQKDTSQSFTWNMLASYPSNVVYASWNWGDSTSSTGLYPSHTYSTAGYYNICVTVSVSCGATYSLCSASYIYRPSAGEKPNSMLQVNVVQAPQTPVGLHSFTNKNNETSIWPNPNTGNFTLKLDGLETQNYYNLKILNILGQQVYEESFKTETKTFSKYFQLNELSNGTYFLRIESENSSTVMKIIVAK